MAFASPPGAGVGLRDGAVAVMGRMVSDPCSPLCPAQSLPLLYSPLNEVVGRTTFSKLIEVLQEMTRSLPESPELPLTMALKNQVCDPEEGRALWRSWGAAAASCDTPPGASPQFGISLLYSLLSHGERLLSSDTPLEPRGGDFETW